MYNYGGSNESEDKNMYTSPLPRYVIVMLYPYGEEDCTPHTQWARTPAECKEKVKEACSKYRHVSAYEFKQGTPPVDGVCIFEQLRKE